jgi:hypothetical protein
LPLTRNSDAFYDWVATLSAGEAVRVSNVLIEVISEGFYRSGCSALDNGLWMFTDRINREHYMRLYLCQTGNGIIVPLHGVISSDLSSAVKDVAIARSRMQPFLQ